VSNAPQRKTSEQNKQQLHAVRGDGTPINEERIVIMGGVPLCGEVSSAALRTLSWRFWPSTLLVQRPERAAQRAAYADVDIMCEMLAALGADVQRHDHTVSVNART
jgi:UDP-N-acetylglucosamine enolpyruvyl transferase